MDEHAHVAGHAESDGEGLHLGLGFAMLMSPPPQGVGWLLRSRRRFFVARDQLVTALRSHRYTVRMPRTKSRRRGRPSAIAKLTVAQLMGEIDRRRAMMGALHAQRADLTQQLEALNAEIAELGSIAGSANGETPRRGRGRPKGSKGRRGGSDGKDSLATVLQSLLRGKTLSVPEMSDAAIRAGYKSKSKNFRNVVALTMLKNQEAFRRVARGQYTAR